MSCHVALPTTLFRARKYKEKGEGLTRIHHRLGDTLWRGLSTRNELQQGVAAAPAVSGYWICLG